MKLGSYVVNLLVTVGQVYSRFRIRNDNKAMIERKSSLYLQFSQNLDLKLV